MLWRKAIFEGLWPFTSAGASLFNSLRPRQNGRHLPDDIFKCVFLNENLWISLYISLKFAHEVWIDNSSALVLIMAWRRLGDKPLSEPMMVNLPTHISVTRPQWVKRLVKATVHLGNRCVKHFPTKYEIPLHTCASPQCILLVKGVW